MPHSSDSSAQRLAEPLILAGAAQQLKAELSPGSLTLAGGARVEVDGVDVERDVYVEVFARQGRLKGAQFHKVARDALKLITIGRERPAATLAIAFGSQEAASCVQSRSWLSESLVSWGVQVLVVELEQAQRDAILQAQARQLMVNAEVPQA